MRKPISRAAWALARFAILLLLAGGPGLSVRAGNETRAADFYVSPNGTDKNPGTSRKPFASVARARDAVRLLKKRNPEKDILVLLRGGTYLLNETIVFSLDDSATEGRTITYAAFTNEAAVFSAGALVRNWKKLNSLPDGIAPVARGHVWTADFPKGLDSILGLYDGSQRLPRARSAGFAPMTKADSWRGSEEDRRTIHFPGSAIRNRSNLSDLELLIIPTCDWSMAILPLAAVDEAKHTATTTIPASYALGAQIKGGHWPETAWIENAPEDLNEPGRWVANSRERKIYFWPPADRPSDNIVAPKLRELIRVEGRVDVTGPKDQPVRGLVFQGITFTHGQRDVWDRDHPGIGLQHDWDTYDHNNALLRFRGAEACAVRQCRFVNSDGGGIRLDLHCRDIRVEENLIAHLGGTGILLSGYGPGTKDCNQNNQVLRNHVHHVGEIYWHSAGIFLTQSGRNRVAHNLIHNVPLNGLVLSGIRNLMPDSPPFESQRTVRWAELPARKPVHFPDTIPFLHAKENVVEFNEIHHAMERLGDGNGIYLSGAGTGNVIRNNYVHDIIGEFSAGAVRTDACQRGTLFEGNVIAHSINAGLIIKDNNDVVNNFIYDIFSGPRVVDGSYISLRGGPNDNMRLERNVCVHPGGKPPSFYSSRALTHLEPSSLAATHANQNLFYWSGHHEAGVDTLAKVRSEGTDADSTWADPKFADPKAGDFRLACDSPVWKLGIKPVEFPFPLEPLLPEPCESRQGR